MDFGRTNKRRASESDLSGYRDADDKRPRKDESPAAANSAAPNPVPVTASQASARGDWVEMNVGGKPFLTTKQTLTLHDSALARMAVPEAYGFAPRAPNEPLRIDRSGKLFTHVLDYLRNGRLPHGLSQSTVHGIALEAAYYGLDPLHAEAKHIYGAREEKRKARGDSSHPAAYAHFVKKVLLHGTDHDDAERKLARLVNVWRQAERTDDPLPGNMDADHERYAEYSAAVMGVRAQLTASKEEKLALLEKANGLSDAWSFVNESLLQAKVDALLKSAKKARATTEKESLVRQALALQPNSALAHFTLATLLIASSRWAEAEKSLRASLQLDPHIAEAYFNLSHVVYEQGQAPAALAVLRELFRLQPDLADQIPFQWAHALALRKSHDYPAAETLFRQLTIKQPNHMNNWLLLLACLRDTEQHEAAVAMAEEAIQVIPAISDHQDFQHWYSTALYRTNRVQDAAAILSKLAANARPVFHLKNLLICYSRLGQWDQAERALVTSQRNDRERAWGHIFLAGLFRRHGDVVKAQLHTDRAHALDPTVNLQTF